MAAANPPAMPRGTGPSAPSDLHNRAKPGGGETLHVCSRETGSAGSTLCSEPPCATCLGKLGPERQAPKPGPQKQGLGPKNKAWASSPQGEGFSWGGTSTLRASRAVLGHLLLQHTPLSTPPHPPLGSPILGEGRGWAALWASAAATRGRAALSTAASSKPGYPRTTRGVV